MWCRAADRSPTTQTAERPAHAPAVSFIVVADGDLAAGDDLGIDAAVGVAEIVHQRARNRHVADAGVGIDLRGRATLDALDHLEPGLADREFAVEQVEFMPGRPAVDIDIAAKAQWIDRRPGRVFDLCHRGEVDDGDHLLRHVREAVAFAEQHLGRPAQFCRHEAAEESFDRQPPVFGPQIAARGLAAFPMDGQRMARLVIVGTKRRQPLVAHQHQEAVFGEIGGRGGIETAGAVLDGVEPVGRQGRAGRERDALEPLRRQPLHRVAVDGLDPGLVWH